MPAVVVDEPLGIACVFSDGRRAVFTLVPPLRTALARDLLAGLGGRGTRRSRRRVLDEVFAELAEEFEEEIRRESRRHF